MRGVVVRVERGQPAGHRRQPDDRHRKPRGQRLLGHGVRPPFQHRSPGLAQPVPAGDQHQDRGNQVGDRRAERHGKQPANPARDHPAPAQHRGERHATGAARRRMQQAPDNQANRDQQRIGPGLRHTGIGDERDDACQCKDGCGGRAAAQGPCQRPQQQRGQEHHQAIAQQQGTCTDQRFPDPRIREGDPEGGEDRREAQRRRDAGLASRIGDRLRAHHRHPLFMRRWLSCRAMQRPYASPTARPTLRSPARPPARQ